MLFSQGEEPLIQEMVQQYVLGWRLWKQSKSMLQAVPAFATKYLR